jgi:transcriptional regulator with XRE-family HTH domain
MPRTIDQAVGTAVRRVRTKYGLTQAGLGRLVGVTADTVWTWETGRVRLSLRRVEQIANALGIGWIEILTVAARER